MSVPRHTVPKRDHGRGACESSISAAAMVMVIVMVMVMVMVIMIVMVMVKVMVMMMVMVTVMEVVPGNICTHDTNRKVPAEKSISIPRL